MSRLAFQRFLMIEALVETIQSVPSMQHHASPSKLMFPSPAVGEQTQTACCVVSLKRAPYVFCFARFRHRPLSYFFAGVPSRRDVLNRNLCVLGGYLTRLRPKREMQQPGYLPLTTLCLHTRHWVKQRTQILSVSLSHALGFSGHH